MSKEESAAEARVRRKAAKMGYSLMKGRPGPGSDRGPNAGLYKLLYMPELGTFGLTVLGQHFEATLAQVDAYLDTDHRAADAARRQQHLEVWRERVKECGSC